MGVDGSAPDQRGGQPARAGASVHHEDIARRAYEIYLAEGSQPGHEVENWLRAEMELRSRGSA